MLLKTMSNAQEQSSVTWTQRSNNKTVCKRLSKATIMSNRKMSLIALVLCTANKCHNKIIYYHHFPILQPRHVIGSHIFPCSEWYYSTELLDEGIPLFDSLTLFLALPHLNQISLYLYLYLTLSLRPRPLSLSFSLFLGNLLAQYVRHQICTPSAVGPNPWKVKVICLSSAFSKRLSIPSKISKRKSWCPLNCKWK